PCPRLYTLSLHDALPIFLTVPEYYNSRYASDLIIFCQIWIIIYINFLKTNCWEIRLYSFECFVQNLTWSTPCCGKFHKTNSVIRSEEHTSELQSRENIVC